MEREIMRYLETWKDSRRRKPLMLTGVRQCGKTYVVKEFGKRCFTNTIYLNFESNERLSSVFLYDFDVERIIREIEILAGQGKAAAGETLVFFDEIQECPRAITALKYFCEEMRELHIVCAGSLLGVALKRENISFPVGKVNRVQMYPMNFKEFACATRGRKYIELLETWDSGRPVDEGIFAPMEQCLKEYYMVGGMPEAVAEWVQSHDISEVETIQDEILADYADDFAKHAPLKEVEKIRWIWDSIPVQLAKENNKFVFSHVKEGKRSAELEEGLQWLRDAGLVHLLKRVEKVEVPLSSTADASYFKVYMSDIGLLRRKSGISSQAIRNGDSLYIKYKGGFAENYVMNELCQMQIPAYFWRSGNTAELDFLFEGETGIIPVEVKSADNTQAKSYRQFCKKYTPKMGIKCSMKNMGENFCEGTKTLSIPLFLLWNIKKYLEKA